MLEIKSLTKFDLHKMPIVKVSVGNETLELIVVDEFFDYLFMKHKVRTPSSIPDFSWLVCLPGYVVVNRLKRVLSDLDYIQVDLYGILKKEV